MMGNLEDADNVVKAFGAFFGVLTGGLGSGLYVATAGLPQDQFGRQHEASGFGTAPAVEAVEKHLGGAAAQVGGRLADEGEAGAEDVGEFEVVKADHGDVLRDA